MREAPLRLAAAALGVLGLVVLLADAAPAIGSFELDEWVCAGAVGAALILLATPARQRWWVGAAPPLLAIVGVVVLLRSDAAMRHPAASAAAALLVAAAVVTVAVARAAAAVTAAPGGVALVDALLLSTDGTSVVLGAVGVAALATALVWVVTRPAPSWSTGSIAAVVVGTWLLLAPTTWGWVGPAELDAYQEGLVVAAAGGAITSAAVAAVGFRRGRGNLVRPLDEH